MEWTSRQMMAIALARLVEDGKTYTVGTGLPLIGATLAKNTHAPNAHLLFESGIFEGAPQEVPKSVSDLRINTGANGIATFCNTIIIMTHEKRRFVERVDYITSPGWVDGPDGRQKRGLIPGKGPQAVVTDLGILRFDENKRMYLSEYFLGVTTQQIIENTGFDLDVSKAVPAEPPTDEMLSILINKVDK